MSSAELFLEKIEGFKADCLTLSVGEIVTKHIILASPFAIQNQLFAQLQIEIGRYFGIHPRNIIMVGSGKLGFSIAPDKRYQPFGDESDIDIAVVSDELYRQIWREVFIYDNSVRNWLSREKFGIYHLKGWIRPDKLPSASTFNRTKEWWEFFQALTASSRFGPYKIRAGLFYSIDFLEAYQAQCVTLCQNELQKDENVRN
jgi:hypothetical protein